MTTPAPASAFPWRRNLYLLWLLQAMTPLGFTFTWSFFPLFFQQLGIEDEARAALWNGFSGWAFGMAMAVFGPIWGIAGDRFGRRRNLIRATLLASVVMTLAGFSQSPSHLVLSRFLAGALGGISVTIMALAGAGTPRRHLAFALGLMQSALFLGTTLGPLFGGIIFDTFGMRAAFYATGSALLSASVIAYLFVREDVRRPAAKSSRPGRPFQAFGDLWRLATSRQMLPILFMIFLANAAQMVVTPVLPLMVATLHEDLKVATASGVLLMAVGGASAVSSVVTARLVSTINVRTVFIIWCIAAAVMYIPAYFAQTFVLLTVFVAAAGLFQGGIAGSANALMALAAPPDKYGSAFGAVQSAIALALGMGPLLGGVLAVSLGLRSVFPAGAVLLVITAIAGAVFLRGQRAPEAAS